MRLFNPRELQMTYFGGPTALIEWGGVRLLTDPTFDPAGTEYPTRLYTLRKTSSSPVSADALGRIDLILLSHDHHFDNLDHGGRQVLGSAGKVLTTKDGAQRLGGRSIGMAPWETLDWPASEGRMLRVSGAPARHGPVNGDRGPVTGFILAFNDVPEQCVYVSGDTVWYEGVAEVARRFPIKLAILFMGAAVVPQVGPAHLTMTAAEGVEAARAFADAVIVPLHFEGWQHFSEGRKKIQRTFAEAGLVERLHWLPPGVRQAVNLAAPNSLP